jgi:deoxyribonuclease-1
LGNYARLFLLILGFCNCGVWGISTRISSHFLIKHHLAEHFGCPNRNDCNNTTYKHAEGDLHNLWLAVKNINSSRSDHLFGETDEGEARFDYCPLFVRTYSPNPIVVEPRDSVKGNIARSLFYMRDEYGFELKGMLPMLKRWNRLDPPAEHEHWRNERIFELQGTRNKFIDNFHLGNSL